MLQEGSIQPPNTKRESGIVCVFEKGASLRICVDSPRFYVVTVCFPYPVARWIIALHSLQKPESSPQKMPVPDIGRLRSINTINRERRLRVTTESSNFI